MGNGRKSPIRRIMMTDNSKNPAETEVPADGAVQKTYTLQDLEKEVKPLSKNSFLRFFQKLYRRWLGVWYGFCDKHEKASKLVYQLFFFCVFSLSVTIYQFIVMTFLPLAFTSLNNGAEGWPGIILGKTGQEYIIFGDGQGMGYFIAFEIAVFTAQCINFPLQRNITYHSHGNPWFQAMWYFIGWAVVSVATSALWGVCNAYLLYWGASDVLIGILKTIITSGISLVVFFFIFMVIFPDNNKTAKKARAKYEKLVASNAAPEKVSAAEAKMKLWEVKAAKFNAESELRKAKSQVGACVMKLNAAKDEAVKAEEEVRRAGEALRADGCAKTQARYEEAKRISRAFPAEIDALFARAQDALKLKVEKEEAFTAAQAL